MSDRIIIQCPGCSAKLAIADASKLGKKIKCSKCAEVFVASAMSSGLAKASKPTKPVSKPKKSDEDEFNLDDMEMEDFSNPDDEESESEAPARSSIRSGKKFGAGKGKAKGKGKKKKSGGNSPLVVGGTVAAVLLIGGGVWLLMGRKNEPVLAPAGQQPMAQQPAPSSSNPAAASTPASVATTANPTAAFPVSMGKFPRAMTELPDWLVQDAPFDVKQFWIKLPPSENAAPPYLDALYEFSHHMESCFPPEVRAQRTPLAKARSERSTKLQIEWYTPQQPKNVAERDAVLQEHVAAFQKLAEAQKRPQCLFEIGWDAPSFLPVIIASREVIRVAQLQVERDLERGNFDSVLRMTNLMLRLSRDLRPRAPMVMQDMASALESMIVGPILIPTLKSPALKTSQCDDLLRLLVQHEAAVRQTNLFLTGLHGDYVWKRMLLHDLQQQTNEFAEARFREAFGVPHEMRGAVLVTALNGTAEQLKAIGTEPPPPAFTQMLNAFVSVMKPADYDADVAVFKEKYQVLSTAFTQPYAARSKAFAPLVEKYQKGLQAQLADAFPPPNTPPEQAASQVAAALEKKLAAGTLRGPFLAAFFIQGSKLENDMSDPGGPGVKDVIPMTRLEGAKSLVAMRRWYGTQGNPPPDFATMCREAGLTDLPRDYFSDGPMRMATFATETPIEHRHQKDLKALAGETIIYSVGSDGVDDKALKDWGYVDPGDFLFRLEIPQSAIPVTPAPAAAPISVSAVTPSSSSGPSVGGALGSEPRFPDAVTQPPQWLIGNAPFDVVKFFEAPPPEQNAAPLYLDAIFEFSAEPANCFHAGSATEQRRQAALDRFQKHIKVFQGYDTCTAEQIDAMLRDHETGFQKLELAQQRPQCLFQTGTSLVSMFPHAQGARQVVRVVQARTYRDLQNGNLDRAIQNIEMCLRLSRDLTRRGVMISQFVSIAGDANIFQDMVRRVLMTPSLKREHCDRLFAVLKQHEDQSRDLLVEGMKGEYVMQRVMLREIQTQTGAFTPEGRRKLQQSLGTKDDSIGAILLTATSFMGPGTAGSDVQQINAAIAKLDERQEITAFDESYRITLSLAEKPYRDRTAPQQIDESLKQKPVNFARLFQPGTAQMLEVTTRNLTRRHGTQALVALRRWQLTHTEPPQDLAQVMSDSGATTVPVDNYGNAPLKLATVNGKPVVYSVGPDGKDDAASVEWTPQSGPNGPGDVLFQLQLTP